VKSQTSPLAQALLGVAPKPQPRLITGFTLTSVERRGRKSLALTLQVDGDQTPRPDWQWFYLPEAYAHAQQAGQAVLGRTFSQADEALSGF